VERVDLEDAEELVTLTGGELHAARHREAERADGEVRDAEREHDPFRPCSLAACFRPVHAFSLLDVPANLYPFPTSGNGRNRCVVPSRADEAPPEVRSTSTPG
jgi:hypothetical protein